MMKDLINGQPEQDIDHCATCIHAADSEDICILRKCKYAIAELIDCYEPKMPSKQLEIIRCRDCKLRDTEYCNMARGFMGMKDDDYCSYAERREVSE